MTIYHYFTILLFLPTVATYDCHEICDIVVQVDENTAHDELKWNLAELLMNRTASSFPFEQYQYSLSNPSNYFEINTPILKFHFHELDREKICEKTSSTDEECALQLQIFTQTAYVVLFKLIILDINDWKPYFKVDRIDLNIRENLPINYRVQLPVAYDHDSSQYNIDHYQFVNESPRISQLFELEKNHDELRLKLLRKLDCEQTNNYQLQIIAVDKGGLKSNVLHVNVTVDDVNEYQPRFKERFYHARLPENVPVTNASIMNVIATDDDCSDNIIIYSLITGDLLPDMFPFEIDRHSGSIFVRRELDYEKMTTYRFRVKASNLDQVTSSFIPVTIDVLDVNDNQPVIQMNILNEYKPTTTDNNEDDFVININENVSLGQVIGTVLIRDADSVLINRRLSLTLLSCWPAKNPCPITLDSRLGKTESNEKQFTGTTDYLIRTSRLLDTESHDDKYTIVLEARDYGDPSLITQRRILIVIHDQNDNAPEFLQKEYHFRLSETSPSGFFIGQVQARDRDQSAEFHRSKYEIVDTEHHDLINIDKNNGSLYLNRKLSAGTSFNLSVKAIDQHNHSLSDQAHVNIIIYDDARCLPIFTQSVYVFNTSENQKIPYRIGQVFADSCLSTSIPISYHIVRVDSLSVLPFNVDPHNGIIMAIQELDREKQTFYKFRIDSLNHRTQQTSQTEINVHVTDQNDHHPSFDRFLNNQREHFIPINRSVPVTRRHDQYHNRNTGVIIASVFATDADEGANGLVNYHFVNRENYDYFDLYSNGSIALRSPHELPLPYRLEIFARDQGSPVPLSSRENIVIHLCDAAKRDECRITESVHHQSRIYEDSNQQYSIKDNRMTANFYLGSIFIMISVLLFMSIIIICIVWNLIIKRQYQDKNEKLHNNPLKISSDAYNCRAEARKNLIVSDSLYDSSPTITSVEVNHRLKSVAV